MGLFRTVVAVTVVEAEVVAAAAANKAIKSIGVN